ncbi:MAG: hypothetical protein BJ554DRAFT_7952, partial [Olpidium bornovanus]
MEEEELEEEEEEEEEEHIFSADEEYTGDVEVDAHSSALELGVVVERLELLPDVPARPLRYVGNSERTRRRRKAEQAVAAKGS